jgi:hypothetical protein
MSCLRFSGVVDQVLGLVRQAGEAPGRVLRLGLTMGWRVASF